MKNLKKEKREKINARIRLLKNSDKKKLKCLNIEKISHRYLLLLFFEIIFACDTFEEVTRESIIEFARSVYVGVRSRYIN